MLEQKGLRVVPEESGKLGGVMYFRDPKPMDHCFFSPEKTHKWTGLVSGQSSGFNADMSGLKVPEGLADITSCWLTEALNASRNSGGPTVTGYSAETLAESKGFMNQLFRLRLHFDPDPADLPDTVIAKLPSAGPLLRTVFDRLGQNRREVRFYRDLANCHNMLTPSRLSQRDGLRHW